MNIKKDFSETTGNMVSTENFEKYLSHIIDKVKNRIVQERAKSFSPVLCVYSYPEFMSSTTLDPTLYVVMHIEGESQVESEPDLDDMFIALGKSVAHNVQVAPAMFLIIHGEIKFEDIKEKTATLPEEVVTVSGMTIDGRKSFGYISIVRDDYDVMLPYGVEVFLTDQLEQSEAPQLELIYSSYINTLSGMMLQKTLIEGFASVGLLKPPQGFELN